MEISVKGASTIFGLAYWVIIASHGYQSLYQMYTPPLRQKYTM
jgi:hypothetical protein